VDINMPLLNGIDLIEKIHEIRRETICIVVTGFDEFEYAQKAVRLGVFDYILKPINEEHFYEVMKKAGSSFRESEVNQKRIRQAEEMLARNREYLTERFLAGMAEGILTHDEIAENAALYEMPLQGKIVFLRMRIVEDEQNMLQKEKDRQLCRFVLHNIAEELLSARGKAFLADDSYDRLLAVFYPQDEEDVDRTVTEIKSAAQKCLKQMIVINTCFAASLDELPQVCLNWNEGDRDSLSRIVRKAKEYIEENYQDSELSAAGIAEVCGVNVSYLSRIFKTEMGVGVIDFLTNYRMRAASILLSQTDLKIYEVAEKTGYKSQHYFSVAFKKVLEVSPMEYRKMNLNQEGVCH
jgi:two-component system response regulator YesN